MARMRAFVKESTITGGTVLSLTLATLAGYARFLEAYAADSLVPYVISNGNNWEAGIGTVRAGNIIERTTPLVTYEGGVYDETAPARINLVGPSNVFCDINSAASVSVDGYLSKEDWAIFNVKFNASGTVNRLIKFTPDGNTGGNSEAREVSGRFGLGVDPDSVGCLKVNGAGYFKRQSTAFFASSYTTLVLDGDTYGALMACGRANPANKPFQTFSGWDAATLGSGPLDVGRSLWFGGGGWEVPDANTILFYTAPEYTEISNTGVVRGVIHRDGNIYFKPATLNTRALSTIHIGPGSATANTAPLQIDNGTVEATPRNNVIENDGSNLRFTIGGTRHTLAKVLTATASLDFPNTVYGTPSDLNITVTGAAVGDSVALGIPEASMTATSEYTARISATNTATVRLTTQSAAGENPAAGTFRLTVIKA